MSRLHALVLHWGLALGLAVLGPAAVAQAPAALAQPLAAAASAAAPLPGGRQPVPALSDRVVDTVSLLSATQRSALVDRLAAFEAQAGTQIVVLIVASTAPEDIAAYAYRVADLWKIGRREVGDGVLLLVARDDRAVRIEVARALEGAIPDLAAFRIIDGLILPAFRQGDFAGGLDSAVSQLMARIRGEGLPLPEASGQPAGQDLEQWLMFFFVGVSVVGSLLTALMGRKLGAVLTAGAAGTVGGFIASSVLIGVGVGVAALVLVGLFGLGAATQRARGGRGGLPHIGGWGGGYGSGGSWGGGGGGGGFSSGGGGSFGGGGASGRW